MQYAAVSVPLSATRVVNNMQELSSVCLLALMDQGMDLYCKCKIETGI